MSDAQGRPDFAKSRQDLLDEIYYLRDVAGERGQQCDALRAELAAVYASRSWRLAAPLRILAGWLHGTRERAVRMSTSDAPRSEPSAADPIKTDAALGTASGRQTDARYLLVDVSDLATHAGRTGVQRVVREIVRALLAAPPDGFVVEPVRGDLGQPWRRAGMVKAELTNGASAPTSDEPVEMRAGDVFLGLDHSMQLVIDNAEAFAQMRAQGVRIWFECNDTLPLDHPEWFPPDVRERFKQWFETIARLGDGIACISRTTADDVRRWVDALDVARAAPLAIGCFAMGADIDAGEFRTALTNDEQAAIDLLPDVPRFLMVGTLEPRKGHAQALEAFNLLWASGADVALAIVGLPGWMTEVLQRRIRHHDEFGKRLFWYAGASDAMLAKLYDSCTALLVPSEGEGFGLPLIEAARRGLPILCRDLPVFREVAGDRASYFSGVDADSLASAIRSWLSAYQRGTVPVVEGGRWTTWTGAARQLMHVVVENQSGTNAVANHGDELF